jgi:class 3 adenylate cyclase
MAVCGNCGMESPDTFRFCPSCASPLAQAPRVAAEERKVVSVLFADLVGFTARAEAMDPEDVRSLLAPYHARLKAELERFGGTVEKFIGDAVMALFGAPVAHEDDPERAVRAALAIRDWVADESGLHVRIAVNTGEALVTLGAHPAEGEAMASGDVVNSAARLQAAAPVDGVLVGERTYRATQRAIDYQPADPVTAKGKTEPLPAWIAVQARSRFGVDLQRPAGDLIGREHELDLLRTAYTRATVDLVPQLVTVVGVPGIGKSRLLAELFRHIDQGDRLVTWRQGRCLPYGEGVSYWALGEMVKAQAGILETDRPEEAAGKLREAVERLIDDETDARWVETHLRPLAGLAVDRTSGDRGGEAFAAWRRFFESLGEARPAVLVFEDLHWADEGLLDFVDELIEWLTDVPVLMVATARPELLARRSAWGGGKANATTISLQPLSDEETARLVHSLLERALLPAETQAALLERAGGNPLYAEEFARLVGERGREATELPGSVHGIIAARLDALDGDDKSLLQDAAVIGKVFWSGALASLTGRDRAALEDRLRGLERRELVRRERRSSVAGQNEYAFRHILVRDVAYAAIPRAARAQRHLLAAQWIDSLGRPDDHADMVAHHDLSALELSRAAGADPGPLAASAGEALRRAGDRAFALNAYDAAIRYYDEALSVGVADDIRPQVLFRLGSSLNRSADERRVPILEAARDAYLAADDAEGAAEASLVLSEAFWHTGETGRAVESIDFARRLVGDRGSTPAAARVLAHSARTAMLSGQLQESLTIGRQALAMAEELRLEDLIPFILVDIGGARANLGDLGGVADLERAIELALASNNSVAARAYNNLAVVLSDRGDTERATELWREGLRVADRLGNRLIGRFIEGQLFWVAFEAGRWDEALTGADAFIAACRAGRPHVLETSAHWTRARILLARNDLEGALAAAERCLELARRVGDTQSVVPAIAVKMRVLVEMGRHEEARALAREIMDFGQRGATPRGTLLAFVAPTLGILDEVHALLSSVPAPTPFTQISLLLTDGRFVEAADLLAAAASLPDEADARLRAVRALVAAGRHAEADEQLRRAMAFYRSVGATRYLREAETLLSASA